ncbi:hypothetical protein PVAND_015672 [Polypedilum vanderplanki]|uniref:Peptidase S1 domain-containing protein n=1 Tax=Polypedilum vanderplanki TaxID=319348 RepID=A0A9J6BD84_POLVA|nr:hypothetical protein PVAND_015672 [Polypedilum vanderplanki]
MFKIVTFLFAIFVLNEARYHRYFDPQNELIETKWMDRRVVGNSGRIVNGEPADIANFPYMLVLIDLVRGGFRCGASVISLHWSLSAAHCTDIGTPYHMVNFRGGSTNRSNGGFIFFVQQYWNHPLYGHPDNARRLAYLTLSMFKTQLITKCKDLHVAACCFYSPNVTDDVCVNLLAGSKSRKSMSPPVMSLAECDRIWGRMGPSFFCMTIINGSDVCGGDSGSPLVTGTGSGRVQHGVVSFGTSDCGDSIPSVHIRIEHPVIRDWIRSHSGI